METEVQRPFNFKQWISNNREEINSVGKKRIYPEHHQFQVRKLNFKFQEIEYLRYRDALINFQDLEVIQLLPKIYFYGTVY